MPQENGCGEDSTQGAFAVGEARVRQESTSEAGSPRRGGGWWNGFRKLPWLCAPWEVIRCLRADLGEVLISGVGHAGPETFSEGGVKTRPGGQLSHA